MAHAAGDPGWVAWTNGVDALTAAHTAAIAGKLDSTTASSTYGRKDSSPINVKDYGAVGDGIADDTAAIQAAIDATGVTTTLRGGNIYVPSGNYKITDTLLLKRKSIQFVGAGWGGSGGGGTVLRWAGSAGIPMLRVWQGWGTRIKNMRLAGLTTARPSAGVSFYNITGDPNGNSHNGLDHVWIGQFEGYDTDLGAQIDYGVLYEGDNVNNDQGSSFNVKIHTPHIAGVKVSNTQNLLLYFNGLYVYYSEGDGLQCSGTVSGNNWFFNANTGSDIVVDTSGAVQVTSFGSEGSGRLATIAAGAVTINGGYFQIRSAGGGKFNADRCWIDSRNNYTSALKLTAFGLTNYPSDTTVGILSMRSSTGGVSKKYLHLEQCTGVGTDVAGNTRIDLQCQSTAPDNRVVNVVPSDAPPTRLLMFGSTAFDTYDPTLHEVGARTFRFGADGAHSDTSLGRVASGTVGVPSGQALRTGASSTGTRPSAVTVGSGATYFDTTLVKPIWSDGTVWRDAAGTAV